MGWYLNYIIPAGAILVGLAASSGYALMSWLLGVKIRRALLLDILFLLFVSYFAAEYVQFRSRGPLGVPTGTQTVQTAQGPQTITHYRRLGFWEYFHLKAINWTWDKESSRDKENEPLGMAGYFFVCLGILGVAFSGLIIPGILGRSPYCELCEQYMRTRQINLLPGWVPMKKASKKDAEGQAAQNQIQAAKFEEATGRLKRMVTAAQNNDPAGFLKESNQDPAERKAAKKLARRLQISLIQCPSCSSGQIAPIWLTGQGKQLLRTKLPKVESPPDFVRAIQKN